MGSDDTATGQLRVAADRAGIQEGGTPTGSDGSEASRASQCALRLILGNLNQNACYMNCLVQALLWWLAGTSAGTSSLGSSAHFFRQLLIRTSTL